MAGPPPKLTELSRKGFDKTSHDFWRTTATELSDAGCTENEIAAVMGGVIGVEVPMSKNYVIRTRQLALNAFNKWQARLSPRRALLFRSADPDGGGNCNRP